MKKYKVVAFKSGSTGLDRLVSVCQRLPKDAITTRVTLGGAPAAGTADRCLDIIERVSNIADDSPGGQYKDEALMVLYGVYQWLQEWAMANPVVSRDYNKALTVSYQAHLEEKGKI